MFMYFWGLTHHKKMCAPDGEKGERAGKRERNANLPVTPKTQKLEKGVGLNQKPCVSKRIKRSPKLAGGETTSNEKGKHAAPSLSKVI